jgi:hypothetical protein
MALEKATLTEIGAGKKPTVATPIPVQFNPESLKLALANKVEGGDTRGRQRRQYLGKTSTTLSFDLHFDTADEEEDEGKPVSVRTKTSLVEKFVLPKGQGNKKQAPPKVRFQWGGLIVDGVIEEVSIDFDLFASDGTPLRAKMTVSIKEQDAKWQLLESGPGANPAGNAPPPGGNARGTGPGTSGGGSTNRTQPALADESAADFLARQGLDPSAWRGIADQLLDPLALPAGLEVDFDESLSASLGIGLSAGIEAGIGVSLEASFGLEVGAEIGISAGLGASISAGFALSAAGGVSAALETVAAAQAETAAADARRAFAAPAAPAVVPSAGLPAARGAAALSGASRAGLATPARLPAPATTPRPAAPEQERPSLARHGFPSRTERTLAAPAPPPPLADPRSTTFGRGVPLRPRVAGGADLRQADVASRIPLRPYERPTDALDAARPGDPPWVRLPRRAPARRGEAGPSRDCGCGCGGGCGGGRH